MVAFKFGGMQGVQGRMIFSEFCTSPEGSDNLTIDQDEHQKRYYKHNCGI